MELFEKMELTKKEHKYLVTYVTKGFSSIMYFKNELTKLKKERIDSEEIEIQLGCHIINKQFINKCFEALKFQMTDLFENKYTDTKYPYLNFNLEVIAELEKIYKREKK
tara:strand:+ start:367 stop:693 length:327 start_codon:yes stop_codon:yes gene_type:complete